MPQSPQSPSTRRATSTTLLMSSTTTTSEFGSGSTATSSPGSGARRSSDDGASTTSSDNGSDGMLRASAAAAANHDDDDDFDPETGGGSGGGGGGGVAEEWDAKSRAVMVGDTTNTTTGSGGGPTAARTGPRPLPSTFAGRSQRYSVATSTGGVSTGGGGGNTTLSLSMKKDVDGGGDPPTKLLTSQRPEYAKQNISSRRHIDARNSRLVERNLPFHQSKNIIKLWNRNLRSNWKLSFMLFREDWFHLFLRLPTAFSVFLMIAFWTGMILVWALIYMAIDREDPNMACGLGQPPQSILWGAAFAFSLETCTTVGYGLPSGSNGFFENCPHLQVAIYFQMTFSMMFNAFLISFFFSRIARCESRGAQVLFSNKSVVRWEGEEMPEPSSTPKDTSTTTNTNPPSLESGESFDPFEQPKQPPQDTTTTGTGAGAGAGGVRMNGTPPKMVFEIQVYDADSKFPLVEAHARLYAVKHTSDKRKNPQPMRILRPNDELGTMLFTSIPTVLTHHVDAYSPLLPPAFRQGADDEAVVDSAGMVLREVDSYNGSRDGFPCPVCGEAYGTFDRLVKHIKFNQLTEKHDEIPVVGSHQEVTDEFLERTIPPPPGRKRRDELTYEDLRQYWSDMQVEIIAVVEGIDPMISGTFQALQSYKIDDVNFGGKFARCLNALDQAVDLDMFHETVQADRRGMHGKGGKYGGYAAAAAKTEGKKDL